MTGIGVHHDQATSMARFTDEHGQRLVQFAYLLSGNHHDAQDLTQSVLYRLSRRGIHDLDDPVAYARRCLINEYRSTLRRLTTALGALPRLEQPAPVPDPSADLEARETTRAALAALTPRQRAAVVLRYYEDWTDEQIAEVLSCAPGTVRSLLSRAKATLRAQLQDHEGEQP